jgi:hypothetical protein
MIMKKLSKFEKEQLAFLKLNNAIDKFQSTQFLKKAIEIFLNDKSKDRIINFLILAGKFYKFDYFFAIRKCLTPKEYWKGLSYAYIHSENNLRNKKIIKKCFQSKLPYRNLLMTKSELKKLNSFPDKIKIYRAMTEKERNSKNYGISWTLNKEIALFFKNKYKENIDTYKHKKVIVSKTINKNKIIAYFNGRKEQEIIYIYK